MESRQQFSANFINDQNKSNKKDIFNNMEQHTISLRKKLNNRAKRYILPTSLTNDLTYEINLAKIEPKIRNQQIYIDFKNTSDEKNSLGLLFQMLLMENNDDILKFSLASIKNFLVDINEQNFFSKSLSAEFNDKLIKFLYELLFKKKNDFYILSNILYILNKLFILIKEENIHYFDILFNYFINILNLAKTISNEEPQIKNLLYYLLTKIFLGPKEIISKLEYTYPTYIQQIHSEIINIDEKKLVKNSVLISTLINLISNCFFYRIYSEYFFISFNNDMNEMNVENIFKFIQKLLNCSYEMVVFEQELRCIKNFTYFFIENENLYKNSILKKKVQKIIANLNLEEKIIPLIYSSTLNDPNLRMIVLQILVNVTYICSKKYCEKLIDNDIATQIMKLQQYLVDQIQITNKIKGIYGLLMDLMYNLIENESTYIIDNLTIENNCISLLFKLQKKLIYFNENKKYMIKIFHILIQSNHKYIQTLLISESICEWYKSILEDEPNADNIEMIIIDFISMAKYSANLAKEDNNKNNLLLIHLEKIGILELVISLKSRNDLSDEVMGLLNEFSNLFNINKYNLSINLI